MLGGLGVDRVVVEEEVDRGLFPPQPHLAVAADLGDDPFRALDLNGQGVERALALCGGREDVRSMPLVPRGFRVQ